MTGYHKQNEACNVAMFRRGVSAVSAPAGLSHGRRVCVGGGGWKANNKQRGGWVGGEGVSEGRPEGQRGLVPQPFVHSSSLCL